MIPWWARMAGKIVCSRLPVGYGFWRRIGWFRHGDMDQDRYAYAVFDRHRRLAGPTADGWTGLELGPGDSLASSLIARSFGAETTWLVDVAPFAEADAESFVRQYRWLRQERGWDPSRPPTDWREAGCRYLTGGTPDLAKIPSDSVDFCWSQAVLEHPRRLEFRVLVDELYRVMRPGATASHRIDLKDHLGGALNNCRFSHATWESRLFADSGFYTNRLRCCQIVAAFVASGFSVERLQRRYWPELPTPRSRLAEDFRRYSDAELRISGFDLVVRKPAGPEPVGPVRRDSTAAVTQRSTRAVEVSG